jgi:hypothetical protein
MQKLKPDLEALSVESFQADADAQARMGEVPGTVRAHAVQNTQQFRCTYFCTYNCTGLPC